jgi:hypothetical protein
MTILRTPNRLDLSLANISATSVMVDWNYDGDPDNSNGVGLRYVTDYELYLPAPTFGAMADHSTDLLTPAQEKIADKSPDRPLPDALRDLFEGTDGYDEWRGGFDPMMNFVWPVCLGYEVEAQDAADLMNRFAPTCTLVSFNDTDLIGDDYGIALTGGGMNLADQLAAAYLCCGCVPPMGLLDQLPGVIEAGKLAEIGPALRKAYKRAAEYYKRQASRAKEVEARLFEKAA